ncbi:VIT1/CCC1 transporter family protein [Thermococcus stetteri]|uniref:VIT1/CCC1 transporter family protein n=1 Tax=Thermococcus stetteri TaxID=49900 RepID=UPI001AE6CC21|nr:VIT1/CCC1 transporter family protein [Thermococcus stetteri]MBP1912321.1 putative membrane protein (TIGR00267 family) [Thermococcus stetteri]
MSRLIELAEKFYRDEYTDSVLYSRLTKAEKDERVKAEFKRLAKIESEHAGFWYEFLKKRGVKPEKPKIGRFHFTSVFILRRVLGAGAVASLLEMGERNAVKKYYRFLTEYSSEMSEEERERLKKVILNELEHEKFFREEEKTFHTGNIRDLVLGMNDGLVEILGAVTGLSAVYPYRPELVGISGLIVGVAGSLSMGIGAFISVRSQRQVNEALREKMEVLFRVSPERAREEIMERLMEGGLPKEIAEKTAEELAQKGDAVISLLVGESDENEIRSALYTGLSYLLGVAFPVTPYFLASSSLTALPFSILLAGTVLGVVGTMVALLSGISIRKKALEMVSTGLGAAFLSYLFGRLMEAVFHVSAL